MNVLTHDVLGNKYTNISINAETWYGIVGFNVPLDTFRRRFFTEG